ncbi:hypothetical protein [Sandarakinorhabdus sp. DWP1-3-1]|uniref:hypothetical protein n=1 Tax=Sandarakinorhabdus sp. DWP1-3-1 TaxID=2804627 RepID=UPI003CE9F4B1
MIDRLCDRHLAAGGEQFLRDRGSAGRRQIAGEHDRQPLGDLVRAELHRRHLLEQREIIETALGQPGQAVAQAGQGFGDGLRHGRSPLQAKAATVCASRVSD